MKMRTLATAALTVALALPAFAGEKGYKCEMDTQTCLNHMVAELKNRGWVGIEMDKSEETGVMAITRVVPGSPAEAGGMMVGDVLKAVNGIEFSEANEASLKKNMKGMVPGAKFTYTVERKGQMKDLAITLGELPPDIMAQWIGMHMKEHAQEVEVAQK